MIFVLEIMQWKQYILDSIKIKSKRDDLDIGRIFPTPTHIPQSTIISSTNNLIQHCILFQSKFLDRDGALQINISASGYNDITRTINDFKFFKSKFDNKTSNEIDNSALQNICIIFDDALREIQMLLNDTFLRFRNNLIEGSHNISSSKIVSELVKVIERDNKMTNKS